MRELAITDLVMSEVDLGAKGGLINGAMINDEVIN
jgi:hypothetical protein